MKFKLHLQSTWYKLHISFVAAGWMLDYCRRAHSVHHQQTNALPQLHQQYNINHCNLNNIHTPIGPNQPTRQPSAVVRIFIQYVGR